jgi:hypothetical protein
MTRFGPIFVRFHGPLALDDGKRTQPGVPLSQECYLRPGHEAEQFLDFCSPQFVPAACPLFVTYFRNLPAPILPRLWNIIFEPHHGEYHNGLKPESECAEVS